MQTRRALLAAGVVAATAGCVGRLTAEPYYAIDARTVHRDEGVLRPSISVADEHVSLASSAAVDVSLENQSSRSLSFASHPMVLNWIGSSYSTERAAAVRDSEYVTLSRTDDRERCWTETERAGSAVSVAHWHTIDANETQTRRLLLASPKPTEGCLSPGTYTFENTYEVGETGIDWTFDIEIREA